MIRSTLCRRVSTRNNVTLRIFVPLWAISMRWRYGNHLAPVSAVGSEGYSYSEAQRVSETLLVTGSVTVAPVEQCILRPRTAVLCCFKNEAAVGPVPLPRNYMRNHEFSEIVINNRFAWFLTACE